MVVLAVLLLFLLSIVPYPGMLDRAVWGHTADSRRFWLPQSVSCEIKTLYQEN